MFRGCHPRQSRHRLSLASCGDNNQFLIRDAADLVNVYQYVGGDFNVSQLLCQFHHVDHTAARNRYFSFAQNRDVNDLLQSVNIGRKSSNDDSRLGATENSFQGAPYHPF